MLRLLLLLIPFVLFSAVHGGEDELVSDLVALRSQSPSGVIHLTDELVSRFLTSVPTPHPYFLIFFDAAQLRHKSELHLQELRAEFDLLSSSFLANNPADSSKLFFFDIEFGESQRSFSLFSVSTLPHIRLIPPNGDTSPSNSVAMDVASFSGLADSMAEFVKSRSGLSIGKIHRPPPVSGRQMILLAVMAVIMAPFAIRKVIRGETLFHDWKLWMFGAVFVYFFSVAGTMHNIIRKMPMFLNDRKDPNKLIFFYQGSGIQLGAEGFAIGFLYTVVGLLIAFMSHVLVKVRSLKAQRFLMPLVMIISAWAVKKVIYLDNWKTGYGVHPYWPSSWR